MAATVWADSVSAGPPTRYYNQEENLTTEYIYDASGNLTFLQEATGQGPGMGSPAIVQAFTYNAGDQIADAGYTYDNNGNLTQAPSPSDPNISRSYIYDDVNQLIEVKEQSATIAQMSYDFMGRRISLTTYEGANPTTTYFHYLNNLLVAQSNEQGSIIDTYAYSPEGGLISVTKNPGTQSETTYFYQTNAHGDVVSLTDSQGNIVNTYKYDPWGKILEQTETIEQPFKYASYYYDTNTDLYYLWHRYYDPETKRFINLDPAGLVTEDTYLYCASNPLNAWDPEGLFNLNKGNPLSKDFYFYQKAYEGEYMYEDMNPIYVIINACYNYDQAKRNGCSTAKSLLEMGLGVLDLGLLVTTGGTYNAAKGTYKVEKVLVGAGKGGKKWVYGSFKSEAKWANQMAKRGWTEEWCVPQKVDKNFRPQVH